MSFFDGVRQSQQARQARVENDLRAQQTARQNQIAEQNFLMAQERAKRENERFAMEAEDRNFLRSGTVTPDALRQRGMFAEANYMEAAAQKKAEEAEQKRKARLDMATTMVSNLSRMKPEEAATLYPKLREQFVGLHGEDPSYPIPAQYDPAWVQSTMAMFTKPTDAKGVKFADYLDDRGNKVTVNTLTGEVVSKTPRQYLYAPERASAADAKALRGEKKEQAKTAANDNEINDSRRFMQRFKTREEALAAMEQDPLVKKRYEKANERLSTGDGTKDRFDAAQPFVGKVKTDDEIRSAAKSLASQGYSKAQIREILKSAGAE